MKPSPRQGENDVLASGNDLARGIPQFWESLLCALVLILVLSLCLSAFWTFYFPPCWIDFSPCTGEYATGDLYHVLMTHNKGKRATSLLPIVRIILGKIDFFYMGSEHTTGSIIEARRVRYFDWLLCRLPASVAKDDKACYQKKGEWHKCGCQRDHEWCQHLVSTW